MPRSLEKNLRDVREGKNLEVYLTLLVALVLIVLDVFGIVSPTVVAAGTLATLALLAYSTLSNREQMQRMIDVSAATQDTVAQALRSQQSADEFFWKEKRLLDRDLAEARFIGVVGVTLGGTVRTHMTVFQNRLTAGAYLRFILIDPATEAPRQAKLRSETIVRDSSYPEFVRATIEHICILSELDSAGKVELGLLPFLPSFGMILIDPDTPRGRIIVEIYQHKAIALSPTFDLNPQRDPTWYAFFRKQFDLLWESCGERRAEGGAILEFQEER